MVETTSIKSFFTRSAESVMPPCSGIWTSPLMKIRAGFRGGGKDSLLEALYSRILQHFHLEPVSHPLVPGVHPARARGWDTKGEQGRTGVQRYRPSHWRDRSSSIHDWIAFWSPFLRKYLHTVMARNLIWKGVDCLLKHAPSRTKSPLQILRLSVNEVVHSGIFPQKFLFKCP